MYTLYVFFNIDRWARLVQSVCQNLIFPWHNRQIVCIIFNIIHPGVSPETRLMSDTLPHDILPDPYAYNQNIKPVFTVFQSPPYIQEGRARQACTVDKSTKQTRELERLPTWPPNSQKSRPEPHRGRVVVVDGQVDPRLRWRVTQRGPQGEGPRSLGYDSLGIVPGSYHVLILSLLVFGICIYTSIP